MNSSRRPKPGKRLSHYERGVFAALIALTVGGVAWEVSRISANTRKSVRSNETVRLEPAASELNPTVADAPIVQ
jgi:hypothetical protein